MSHHVPSVDALAAMEKAVGSQGCRAGAVCQHVWVKRSARSWAQARRAPRGVLGCHASRIRASETRTQTQAHRYVDTLTGEDAHLGVFRVSGFFI